MTGPSAVPALREAVLPPTPAENEASGRLPGYPVQVLPPTTRGCIEAFADAVDATVALVASSALAVAGAALGPQWRVRARSFERGAAHWSAVVASSGSAKTPAAKPLLAPLFALDATFREEYREALKAHKQAAAAAKRARVEPADEPRRRRVIITDTTPEAFVEALADAEGHGVLVASDELATHLSAMDGYRASGGSRLGRSLWLSLWSGTPIRSARKTARSSDVDEPYACVYAGVQPTVLSTLGLRDGDGLCARYLWSIVPGREHGLGREIPAGVVNEWRRLVKACGAVGPGDRQRFGPDAEEYLDARLREWTGAALRHEEAGAGLVAAMYGKAGDHLVRLTALLHGLDAAEAALPADKALPFPERRPVPIATVERAGRLVEYHLAHGERVAQLVTADEQRQSDVARVLAIARAFGGRVTARDLMQADRARFPTVAHAEAALWGAVAAGRGTRQWSQPGPQGGRPTHWYLLDGTTGGGGGTA